MKYALIVLPFLAAAAWGQDDIYKSLALGDRVQITFRSGGTINGNLEPNPMGRKPKAKGDTTAEPPVDYTKAESHTVNLSWEYPGLEGTMTILKKEIKEVRKLQTLDPETMERLKKQREQIRKDLEEQNAEKKADDDKRQAAADKEARKLADKAKTEEDDAVRAAEEAKQRKELEEGQKILKRFPPDAGWGSERLDEIQAKSTRKNSVITPDEMEFMRSYQQWVKAKDAQSKTPEK